MEVNRRQFVAISVAACTGCAVVSTGGDSKTSNPGAARTVDAGPLSLYAGDGVYDHFRHTGFFLVRNLGQLIAISSDCTHRDCPLRALADHTFSCNCHGSKFDHAGTVLRGPAQRSLPRFPTTVSADGHLIVQVTRLKFDEE